MKKKSKIHIAASIVILVFILSTTLFLKNTGRPSSDKIFSLGENTFGMRFINTGENESNYVRSQMTICYKNGSDVCYREVTSLLYAQFDYQTLLSALEGAQNYPEVFARCHAVTHFIGRSAYKTNPDIRNLYERGSPACWGGFYHGVIEAYFDERPYESEEQFARGIRNVCGSESDYSTPRFFHECLHGIGHAMMFVSDDNLPKSLRWCDKLPTNQKQGTCHGGVFMENSSSSTNTGSGHISKYIKNDDPLYPCDILEEKYLSICYQYQSSYFAQLVKHDWKKTGDLCLKVPKAYQLGCFRIIGSNQVGFTQDPKIMNQTCNSMPNSNAQDSCVLGVVSGLMGRYINKPNMAEQFCALVTNKHKQNCWTSIGSSLSSWSGDKSKVAHFCEINNEKHAAWCFEGLENVSPQPIISN